MEKAKKKKIFKSLDAGEKLERLTSLAENKRELQIWENVENTKREFFEVQNFKQDTDTLILKLKAKETSLPGKQVLINFEVEGHEFFSVGNLKPPEGSLYELALVPKIFRFEKRKYMRIPNDFARRMSIKVSEGESVNYFKLDNVSPEGAAMILSSEKQRYFKPQTKIKSLVLELNEHIYKIANAVVQHSTTLEDSPELIKVGMRFKEIDPREKRALVREVQNCLYKALKKDEKES